MTPVHREERAGREGGKEGGREGGRRVRRYRRERVRKSVYLILSEREK